MSCASITSYTREYGNRCRRARRTALSSLTGAYICGCSRRKERGRINFGDEYTAEPGYLSLVPRARFANPCARLRPEPNPQHLLAFQRLCPLFILFLIAHEFRSDALPPDRGIGIRSMLRPSRFDHGTLCVAQGKTPAPRRNESQTCSMSSSRSPTVNRSMSMAG